MNFKILFLIYFLLTVSISVLINADSYLTVKSKIRCVTGNGWPQNELKQSNRISSKGIRLDYGNGMHLLFIAKSSSFYLIYPGKKEYSSITYSEVKPILDQIDQAIEISKVEVKKGDENKKVGRWNASVWNLIPNRVSNEKLWISTEFKIPVFLKKYYTEIIKFQGKVGLITKARLDIGGIVLKRIATLKVGDGPEYTTSYEVFDISTKKIPDSVFMIPEGYKEVSWKVGDYFLAFQNIF